MHLLHLWESFTLLHQSNTHTHTQSHNRFTALWILSGTTRVSWYQKKHSLTRTHHGHQISLSASSICYDPWHPPCSISLSYCIIRCWWNCADWLSWAWQHHHKNLLHWSDQKSSGSIEGEESRKVECVTCVVECCFTWTMHLLTQYTSEELAAIQYTGFQLLHHPPYSSNWLQLFIICFQNWRNSWKEANLLMTKTLSARQMAGWKSMIISSSTVESEL